MNFDDIIDEQEDEFISLFPFEDMNSMNAGRKPKSLPILALKNTVLFPGVILPISVGRHKSLQLIREQHRADKLIGCLTQTQSDIDNPNPEDLYQIGTVAKILKIIESPDGYTTVILQGKRRFRVIEMVQTEPYFKANVTYVKESSIVSDPREFHAVMSSIKDLALQIAASLPQGSDEVQYALKNIKSDHQLINIISNFLEAPADQKQEILELTLIDEQAMKTLTHVQRQAQINQLKNEVQAKVKKEIDQQQREYFLHQQMRTIQEELGQGGPDSEIEEMKAKAADKKWNAATAERFDKELTKLSRTNPASPEWSIQINYLNTLLDLPWDEYSSDNFDLHHAKNILDQDHFGLEKVKDRILEHLAVLKLKGDLKSPILCLHGPPGVGKTSLGKSIARAIGRSYVRISLGGLHDESEIRGHRKTYIGAMPGRIIQNIRKAGSGNPVFVLDEIDKVGSDFRGDPSSALLEVLDPEQNNSFHDNYLELDYDLSKVMFIATANTTSTMAPALLDRMELIDVSGYLVEEKVEIAKRHLIPKQLENHGLSKQHLSFPKKIVELIIEQYTRESGVRQLEKKFAKICRHVAKLVASDEDYTTKVSESFLTEILGPPEYLKNSYQTNESAGVVNGLAWTATGGQLLYIETSLSKGKGNLTLTGNLGNVMKESAVIALEYIKSHCENLSIDPEIFDNYNIHLHVPEGAIPKDGPSAGITMATSMASAFTQRKVKNQLAMTGEITLRGKVLPVGGIKEKILAAKRANIKEIVISEENKNDISQIKEDYIKGLTIHYVKDILDVLELALTQEKVKNARKL